MTHQRKQYHYTGGDMRFIMAFLTNLGLLLVGGLVLYIIFPEIMGNVYRTFGLLFGPLALLFVIVAALPRGRRRSRR
jgi:hypothetical protein